MKISHAEDAKRGADIAALGAAHGFTREALEAVQNGVPVASFRNWIAQAVAARIAGSPRPATILDISPREQRAFSFADLANSLSQRNFASVGGYEREVHEEIERGGHKSRHGGALAPLDYLVQRTNPTLAGSPGVPATGTGGALIPAANTWVGYLQSQLALGRAGVQILSGITGELRLVGLDDPIASDAETPGETGSIGENDVEFAAKVLSSKSIRTKARFSRSLLNTSNPSVDALVEKILRQRIMQTLEKQCFYGTGAPGELLGLANLDHLSGSAVDSVTYAKMLSVVSDIDDAKGLAGPLSFITTRKVVNAGLSQPRNTGFNRSTFEYYPGAPLDQWMLDDVRVFRSHEVSSTSGSPAVLSDIFAGSFESAYLAFFGSNIVEILPDPYTSAGSNIINLWAFLLADFGVAHEASFAFASVDPSA